MKMLHTIPAIPVRSIVQSIAFYRDILGFKLVHHERGFAIFQRDAVHIHLWHADDESWRTRTGSPPVCTGSESFIAGTVSCRVAVEGVDELYRELQPRGILHPNGTIADRPWGTREFGVLDRDNNIITFFENK